MDGRPESRHAIVASVKPNALDFVLLTVCGWVNRRQLAAIDYLQTENRVLREHLGHRRLLLTDAQRRQLAVKGRALGLKKLTELCCIVKPATILGWYRKLIATKYDGSAKRGRPRKPVEVRELVLRMARENRGWGYDRIVGAMMNLGLEVHRSTVARILADHGLEPAPERLKGLSWSEFLRAHWGAIAGADFFTVEALTLTGLVRYHVFFVIDLKTRAVEIAGIVHQPHGQWMMQIGRNLLDAMDGFLLGKTHLILDRDPVFTDRFRRLLKDAGVDVVRLPPKSPNLNAYAERFVGSIRRECLDKVVLLGERHLRDVVREFAAHYHLERNHQGIDNQLIAPLAPVANLNGAVRRSERLGGMLKYYHREAA